MWPSYMHGFSSGWLEDTSPRPESKGVICTPKFENFPEKVQLRRFSSVYPEIRPWQQYHATN